MTHYHAGWSLPGCLPEMEPATFRTEREGEAFIEDERRSVAESFDDDDYQTEDPYTYWVDPCDETDCHEHEWGPIEHARMTGNPHRQCQLCSMVSLDLDDSE